MLLGEKEGICVQELAYKAVMAVLPDRIREEIECLARGRKDRLLGLSEIRLRCPGECSAVVRGENLPLMASVGRELLYETFKRVCGRAIYAHRDSIKEGYIPMDYGVRVGVAGTARYDEGRLVGVSSPGSLIFRLPTGRCDFGRDLARKWCEMGRENMLIIAPPGGGKTTALRSLAYILGSGREAIRVVAVDERCEFIAEEYVSCFVDIVRGYGRARGIEMALRTMSPELILVDEIASLADADAVRIASGVGVPVIATAHAREPRDLRTRNFLCDLVAQDNAVFRQIAVIRRTGGRFLCDLKEIQEEICKV